MQSSGTLDCSAFDTYNSNKVIKGNYVCKGSLSKPGGANTKPSSGAATSSSAAQPLNVNIPTAMGGTSILAGLLQLLL